MPVLLDVPRTFPCCKEFNRLEIVDPDVPVTFCELVPDRLLEPLEPDVPLEDVEPLLLVFVVPVVGILLRAAP